MRIQSFITGMGCISHAGNNLSETMNCLYSGKRNPEPPSRISYKLDKDYPVFEVFDCADKANDLSYYFAEIAVNEALKQAGLTPEILARNRVGVFLGSTAGCFFNREDYYRSIRSGESIDKSYLAQVLLNGSIAHQIARNFQLTGPAMTLSNACASGTDAIGLASAMIERGECDMAIAGGTDEIVRMVYLGFISLMNTSDAPCLPFSQNRKGLNLGEGAGICVLESPATMEKRGVSPLSCVLGYSTISDSYHITAPEPNGRGLRKAFQNAMTQADVKTSDIAFINAHGTGTSENDKVEGLVIADIFGHDIPVTATKAYTGHTLGAAGGIEAVISAQFLLDGKIPGTPGYADFDPVCQIKIPTANQSISGQVACSSSLAFGGVNSVIVLGRPS